MGLGYLYPIFTESKSDGKKNIISELNIRPYFSAGTRVFKFEKDYYNSGSGSGNISTDYSFSPEKKRFYFGEGVGIDLSLNRYWTSIEVGLDHYNESVYHKKKSTGHHPNAPWGSNIVDYYQEEHFTDYKQTRFRFSLGQGFKIFLPNKKFNIIPSVRFSVSTSIYTKTISDYHTVKDVYYWAGNPNPQGNYEWDSTYNWTYNIKQPSFIELTIGSFFIYKINKRFTINAEISFVAVNSNMLNMVYVPVKDRSRTRNTLGVSYCIPLRTIERKSKDIPKRVTVPLIIHNE